MSKNLEKLKQFFRSNRGASGQDRVQVLTAEIERELKKDNAIEKRIKLLKELGDVGKAVKLEEVNKLTVRSLAMVLFCHLKLLLEFNY